MDENTISSRPILGGTASDPDSLAPRETRSPALLVCLRSLVPLTRTMFLALSRAIFTTSQSAPPERESFGLCSQLRSTRKMFLDLSEVSRLRRTLPRTQKAFLDLTKEGCAQNRESRVTCPLCQILAQSAKEPGSKLGRLEK